MHLLYRTGLMQHQEILASALLHGIPDGASILLVDIGTQALSVYQHNRITCTLCISTSAHGPDNRADSLGTPTGWHAIVEIIGKNATPGQVFSSRKPTADILSPDQWKSETKDGLILTRILRLRGLQPGVNQGSNIDTYDRMIYLHGTNREQILGTPATSGCVNLGNYDIVQLTEIVGDGPAWCWIGQVDE